MYYYPTDSDIKIEEISVGYEDDKMTYGTVDVALSDFTDDLMYIIEIMNDYYPGFEKTNDSEYLWYNNTTFCQLRIKGLTAAKIYFLPR